MTSSPAPAGSARLDAIPDGTALAGSPWPLGATPTSGGVNFALRSGSAERVELCLFGDDGSTETARIPLQPSGNQVWHGLVAGARPGQRYGYRVFGPYDPARGLRFNPNKLLLDPYARAWDRDLRWADPSLGHQLGEPETEPAFDPRDNGATMTKCVVSGQAEFDWGDDRPPLTPLAASVLYELHVKGFTALHPDVPEKLRGTFAGLAHPGAIGHLQRLGVTAVELLPVMGFIDEPFARRRGLVNYWGYNTLGFFMPDGRYAVSDARAEFKQLVRALHQAGIEVILDVVLNHTGEGDHAGPTLSFRGIDNPGYYRLEPNDLGRYQNQTGTGNVLDYSRPAVVAFAMDVLRWWAAEYRVDGFRFDLATILGRGRDGSFDAAAPLLTAIMQDPLLQQLKLIAEPWDLAGYDVGGFVPGWTEWNDRSRDDFRRFCIARDVGPGALADRLAGSSDKFRHDGRLPTASLNFVTCHDGFTLDDLVTYAVKRNQANGEANRDGNDNNHGWNAGVEGPSADPSILTRRQGLKRLILTALMLARGVPMLSMGDEIGHSQDGNNNAWCQDSAISWLDWNRPDQALLDFVTRLLKLRREKPPISREAWLDPVDVEWLGPAGGAPAPESWRDPGCRTLGLRWRGQPDLLALFNAGTDPVAFALPSGSWRLLLDSADRTGGELAPFSARVLEQVA